jgi:hypothetical protein
MEGLSRETEGNGPPAEGIAEGGASENECLRICLLRSGEVRTRPQWRGRLWEHIPVPLWELTILPLRPAFQTRCVVDFHRLQQVRLSTASLW